MVFDVDDRNPRNFSYSSLQILIVRRHDVTLMLKREGKWTKGEEKKSRIRISNQTALRSRRRQLTGVRTHALSPAVYVLSSQTERNKTEPWNCRMPWLVRLLHIRECVGIRARDNGLYVPRASLTAKTYRRVYMYTYTADRYTCTPTSKSRSEQIGH